MTVLGGVAYWLVDMRDTLPRNPYPIASSMALFAGSRFLETGLDMMEVVKGKKFRLGWWDDAGSDRRGSRDPALSTGLRDKDLTTTKRFGVDMV